MMMTTPSYQKLDRIAFNQEELEQIIHRGSQTIYLFDNTFAIPADNCVNTFIGIGTMSALWSKIRRDYQPI